MQGEVGNDARSVLRAAKVAEESGRLAAKIQLIALESAGGRFVYYAKRFPTRRIYWGSVAGGGESKVLEGVAEDYRDLLKDGIFFIDWPRSTVKFFRFASGLIERVTELPEGKGTVGGLSVSPDGRWLLYTQLEQYEIDLILVENFW